MPQLSKTDLFELVEQFTTNIEDRLVTPHIQKTIEIGFVNVLPQTLINALVALDLTSGGTELKAFWNDYFKQVWAYKSYVRFFTWHGNNITQFGLVNISDDSTQRISDKVRGELISNIESDLAVYHQRMMNRLTEVNYTFDSVVYTKIEVIRKPTNRFKIRGI